MPESVAYVFELGPLALENQADRERGSGCIRGVHHRPPTVASLDRDESFGFEHPERLAKRREAHPELDDEVLLAGQGRAVRKLSSDDHPPEQRGHVARGGRVPEARDQGSPKRSSARIAASGSCEWIVTDILRSFTGLRSSYYKTIRVWASRPSGW